MTDDKDKPQNLVSLVKRRTGQGAGQVESPNEEPNENDTQEDDMNSAYKRPPASQMTFPAEPPKARRPRIKPRPRHNLPRATYYLAEEHQGLIRYYAAVDGRQISAIVQEAVEQWITRREAEEDW